VTAADDAKPAVLTQKPSWLVSEVSRVAHRLLTGKLATAGSRGYHYRLLAALQEFGPASQAKLGRRTGMDRSDVVAAVNELVGRGLADRSPDPADGAATSLPSPRPAPPISGGWRSSWTTSRTSCSLRSHQPNASS
jgi:MarR family